MAMGIKLGRELILTRTRDPMFSGQKFKCPCLYYYYYYYYYKCTD